MIGISLLAEARGMSSAEKYAAADFNAVKSHERSVGGFIKVFELVSQGDISPQTGAKNLGITTKELRERMLLTGFAFPG